MSEPVSAARVGLIACSACTLVVSAKEDGRACPRCGVRLRARKPDAVRRTWALLLSALAMYAPANLLPFMTTTEFAQTRSYTILGGVGLLWASGSWDLALIVFIASVVVPLGKILALSLLVFTVERRSSWRQGERTRLYWLVELVGRWAMLDIFVVALLVGFVQFGPLANITPDSGVIAFALVVVLTILATMSFDPRQIWDSADAG